MSFKWSAILLIICWLVGCSEPTPPSQGILLDGVNWAVSEELRAGTHTTGFNTRYVPISPGECQSVKVKNQYMRKIGDETYHFYELEGQFAREKRTYQVGFVQRGKEWFYRLGN